MTPRSLGVAALACTATLGGPAAATPQANAAWATGVCGTGAKAELWQETSFCNGLRADVLFGRDRGRDFALGPYAQINTAGFWDARYGAGLSVLVPVSEDFPLVLSLGAGGHELDALQAESWLFWGTRSYNFHGSYSMAAGLLLGASRDLAGDGRSALFAGVQIDGLVLGLPFLLAYEAIAD
jgi:hypothetical protein